MPRKHPNKIHILPDPPTVPSRTFKPSNILAFQREFAPREQHLAEIYRLFLVRTAFSSSYNMGGKFPVTVISPQSSVRSRLTTDN